MYHVVIFIIYDYIYTYIHMIYAGLKRTTSPCSKVAPSNGHFLVSGDHHPQDTSVGAMRCNMMQLLQGYHATDGLRLGRTVLGVFVPTWKPTYL